MTQLEQDLKELELNPSRLKWVIQCAGRADRDCIARYTNDLQVIEILARDKDGQVRSSVAANINTPPPIKAWLTSGYRDTMSLEEFLEATK